MSRIHIQTTNSEDQSNIESKLPQILSKSSLLNSHHHSTQNEAHLSYSNTEDQRKIHNARGSISRVLQSYSKQKDSNYKIENSNAMSLKDELYADDQE